MTRVKEAKKISDRARVTDPSWLLSDQLRTSSRGEREALVSKDADR
jgi:hypothetical protein